MCIYTCINIEIIKQIRFAFIIFIYLYGSHPQIYERYTGLPGGTRFTVCSRLRIHDNMLSMNRSFLLLVMFRFSMCIYIYVMHIYICSYYLHFCCINLVAVTRQTVDRRSDLNHIIRIHIGPPSCFRILVIQVHHVVFIYKTIFYDIVFIFSNYYVHF